MEWFFRSCGLGVEAGSNLFHPWHCPSHVPEPSYHAPWEGNKISENIARPYPLPYLGQVKDVWGELMGAWLDLRPKISDDVKAKWTEYLDGLPRPLILTHTRGRTCAENKNIDHYQDEMFATLVDQGASVLHLDWDRASPDYHHPQIHDVCVNGLSIEEMVCLIYSVDAMIGIDSGPCHFARLNYSLPTLQVWTKHIAPSFVLPRPDLVALTDQHNPAGVKWTERKRHQYNILEVDQLSGQVIAETCLEMLKPRLFNRWLGGDLLLQNLLVRMRSVGQPYRDQFRTFGVFLASLQYASHVIQLGEFSEGGITSTYVLGLFVDHTCGYVYTLAPEYSQPFSGVRFYQPENRIEFLQTFEPSLPPRGLVVGKTDPDTALAEVQAVLSMLAPESVILVDDCPYSCRDGMGGYHGTGTKVVPYLLANGWEVVVAGYQCVLRRKAE